MEGMDPRMFVNNFGFMLVNGNPTKELLFLIAVEGFIALVNKA